MNAIKELTSHVDASLNLLIKIKDVNNRFYNEFVREFLTDRLTFTNFEKDLVRALAAIAGIVVYVSEDDIESVWVQHGDIHDRHDDYASALEFAVALLHISR